MAKLPNKEQQQPNAQFRQQHARRLLALEQHNQLINCFYIYLGILLIRYFFVQFHSVRNHLPKLDRVDEAENNPS